MTLKRTRALPFGLALLMSFVASAQSPSGILNHQGIISVDGAPFDGTGSFKFALVNSTGTITYWSNDGTSSAGEEPAAAVSLSVDNGRYSVALGDASLSNMAAEVPSTLFADNTEILLRVWFNDGANGSQQLTPDQRISAVGYALNAAQAQSVPEGAITANKLANGSVGTDQVLAGLSFNGSFEGDGSALIDLDSLRLTGGLSVRLELGNVGHIVHDGSGTLARDVVVKNNYAYLANSGDGLRIYDVSDPANLVTLGHDAPGSSSLDVAVVGDIAYLANNVLGLRIYNVSDRSNPVERSRFSLSGVGGEAIGIKVAGKFAYLASGSGGLKIFNIVNPGRPELVGEANSAGKAVGIDVKLPYIYVAFHNQGLKIFRIKSAHSEQVLLRSDVTHIGIGGNANDVVVADQHAYVACHDGLRIYEVSDPVNPVLVSHMDHGGSGQGVKLAGTHVYLACGGGGLRIYEISQPANPVQVGHIDSGGSALGVTVSGDYIYLANGDDGLRVYDSSLVAVAPSFIGDGSRLTGIDIASVLAQGNDAEGSDLTNLGNLGIGKSTPSRGLVDIEGSVSRALGSTYGFLNKSGSTGTNPGTNTPNYSVYASNRVAAAGFNAHSDARIKQIQGLAENETDLGTLMEIEVTDYTMIDQISRGAQPYKKVIGQQVRQVYPQAVTRSTDAVPDIYRAAEIEDGWIALPTGLQPGEKVKLITQNHTGVHEVLAVRADAFRVDEALSGEVFVYGRQVDDFHTVDYEAIAMLNVSATQARQRIIERQEAEIVAVKRELASLTRQAARNQALQARLTTLERVAGKFLSGLAPENTPRTATLIPSPH